MKGVCSKVQDLVEEIFDEKGMMLQNAYSQAFSFAYDVVMRPPFSSAAMELIDQLISSVKELNSKIDWNELKYEFSRHFVRWFAEVLNEVDKPGSGMRTWRPNYNEEWNPKKFREKKNML